MTRWWRRIGLLAAGALVFLIIRTAVALWPPAGPAWPEWDLITGVTVINPGRDRRVNQTIVMRNGRIETIRDRQPDRDQRARARYFQDLYVLPGLIDMDVRALPSSPPLLRLFGLLFLNAGVTTVRDLGGVAGDLGALQRQISAGEFPWPRLIACGRILGDDAPHCPTSRIVRTPADARQAVGELAALGAACIAADRTMTAELLAAVQAAAAAKGLPVVGDIPVTMPIGASTLTDARLLSALPPAPPGDRVADAIRAWQTVDPAGVDALVHAAAGHDTTYSTGLVRWSQLVRRLESTPEQYPLSVLLPRFYRDVIWRREVDALLAPGPESQSLTAVDIATAVAQMQRAVDGLHDAGARIVLGTGTPSPNVVPGFSVWFELQNMVAAGLTPEAAWLAATRAAGETLGIPQLGALEDGAPADLLAFRNDPTRDLAALSSLEAVVTGGRVSGARRVNGEMLEYARYVQRSAYDWLSMLWVRLTTWWAGETNTEC